MSTLNNVLSTGIQNEQWIAVKLSQDGKNICAWVLDPALGGPQCPPEPPYSLRSTSATTITNALNGSMPTLGT